MNKLLLSGEIYKRESLWLKQWNSFVSIPHLQKTKVFKEIVWKWVQVNIGVQSNSDEHKVNVLNVQESGRQALDILDARSEGISPSKSSYIIWQKSEKNKKEQFIFK